MSDDDKNDHTWEGLPRPTKIAVYAYLRTMIAKHAADGATATVLRDVASHAAQTPIPIGALETMNSVMEHAFAVALATLEDADPELCIDCGGYHDDNGVHVPSSNPKDLS